MFLKDPRSSKQHLNPQSLINTSFQLVGTISQGFHSLKSYNHMLLHEKIQCCKWNCLAYTIYIHISAVFMESAQKNILSFCSRLIVLVCKLLSIPVYPEWWNNKASHVAKGCSKCTGDGPYLRIECMKSKREQMFSDYLSTRLSVT